MLLLFAVDAYVFYAFSGAGRPAQRTVCVCFCGEDGLCIVESGRRECQCSVQTECSGLGISAAANYFSLRNTPLS